MHSVEKYVKYIQSKPHVMSCNISKDNYRKIRFQKIEKYITFIDLLNTFPIILSIIILQFSLRSLIYVKFPKEIKNLNRTKHAYVQSKRRKERERNTEREICRRRQDQRENYVLNNDRCKSQSACPPFDSYSHANEQQGSPGSY